MRDEMVFAVRHGLFDIVKIQTLAVLVMVVFAPTIFDKLGISPLYLPLFYVDAVAASMQVALLAVMNVLYTTFNDPKYRPATLLQEMVDAGRYGRKSGRGFYNYAK